MTAPDFTQRPPDFTTRLREQTERIVSARVVANAIVEGQEAKKELKRMSDKVLIKGLSEALAEARKSIAAAREAPIALKESAAALIQTCTDLKAQVDALHEDIKFEATQLGNGGPHTAS